MFFPCSFCFSISSGLISTLSSDNSFVCSCPSSSIRESNSSIFFSIPKYLSNTSLKFASPLFFNQRSLILSNPDFTLSNPAAAINCSINISKLGSELFLVLIALKIVLNKVFLDLGERSTGASVGSGAAANGTSCSSCCCSSINGILVAGCIPSARLLTSASGDPKNSFICDVNPSS